VAVTPNSDDERPRSLPNLIMMPDLALAVEGLRIHEHEESFPSEGEDDEDDDDLSIPPSEDASEDDEDVESSDEETILAPRTHASLDRPISDDTPRARYPHVGALNIVFPRSLNPKTLHPLLSTT